MRCQLALGAARIYNAAGHSVAAASPTRAAAQPPANIWMDAESLPGMAQPNFLGKQSMQVTKRSYKKQQSMQVAESALKESNQEVGPRPGRSRMLNRGGTSDSYAIGSIRQYSWLRRLFLEPDKLELQRGEISVRKNSEPHVPVPLQCLSMCTVWQVVEQLMIHGNSPSVARLWRRIKSEGATGCFESPLLCNYFDNKLRLVEMESAELHANWFDDVMEADEAAATKAFDLHQAKIDDRLRLSASSMVWLARERAIIDSTLTKQTALTMKILAAMVTAAMWALGAFTAFMSPADSTCVSVCPVVDSA